MRHISFLLRPFLLALVVALTPAVALAAQSPAAWVKAFWPTAKAAGVSYSVYMRALGDFEPDPDVIKRAGAQAEFNMAIWDYMDQMVSDDRITQGLAALQQNGGLLARIEKAYGVDRYTVLAVWGIESHYGAVFSNPRLVKGTIRSLATLAYNGGRLASFGRKQLVAALKIVQRGDVDVDKMYGSWAGAMGQTQFIPTTFLAYAVDFDGDGHRNIWTSNADALASTAAFLKKSGWQSGETWGYEVTVPDALLREETAARIRSASGSIGVCAGRTVPPSRATATRQPSICPTGAKGRRSCCLANFRVIKRYNNANSYALAVGHLSDRLRGYGGFVAPWPPHEKTFSLDEARRMQVALMMAGYYSGAIDGDLGSGSRDAIREYQRSIGATPDGVPTRALLQRLEQGK